MKKVAGNILIVLSIVCITVTIAWVMSGFLNQSGNPTEDERTTSIALWLFAGIPGVLLILDIVLFLCGFYLRKPATKVISEQKQGKSHLFTLLIYLVICIALGIISGFSKKILPETKVLGFLIAQPQVFTQLIVGIIPGIKIGTGLKANIVMTVSTLLYFMIFLFPLYRIVTMDRKNEVVAYKRMKLLFILFIIVHILLAFVILFLAKA